MQKWGTIGLLTPLLCLADPTTAPSSRPAAPSPHDGEAAYVYHLDGNLDNAGSAGAAGNLIEPGFASFEPSAVDPTFGKMAVDCPKMGKNHVQVPLSSLTDEAGSFTVDAVFKFPTEGPNADPDKAKFTIASYGGETDGPAGTSGGGFYLNYNADADAAATGGKGAAGRVQLVVDDRVRGGDNGFSRRVMVNALMKVTADPGKVYRIVGSFNNVTGEAAIGWSEVAANTKYSDLPPAHLLGKVSGNTGLVIGGTSYDLSVGGAMAEDGGNGFGAAGVMIDDVRFVAGVDRAAFTAGK